MVTDEPRRSPERSPFISVIVPAYNAASTLGDCLRALSVQTVPRSEYELIVVDDGSTDDTAQVAARFGARLIRQAHHGRSTARNQGIWAATGDIVCFTDADCAPAPDWIEAMGAPFVDSAVAGCKGVYRTRQREWVARFAQAEFEDKYRLMARMATIDFVDSHAAAFRTSVLRDAGGFDESMLSAEDTELTFRLSTLGHRLVFNPRGVVYHQHPTSMMRYIRRKLVFARWRVVAYGRYPRKLAGDSNTPEVLRYQLILAGLMAPALLACPFLVRARWLLLALALVFGLTTVPFCVRTWRADRAAACIAPVMLWARAVSLGLGLIHGVALRLIGRAQAGIDAANNVTPAA